MRVARRLSREFVRNHPADAARILEDLAIEQAGAALEELPPAIAARAVQSMSYLIGAECLGGMSDRRAGAILGAMPVDEAAGRLLRLSPPDRKRLLSEMPAPAAASLRQRLGYPEGTAGALVDTRVPSFPDGVRVDHALSRLRRASRFTHYYVYVVDREGKLVGVLSLRELMLAQPKQSLASVMCRHVERLSAEADRLAILGHPAWQRVHALPVVDSAGRFMGVVAYETLRRLEAEQLGLRRAGPSASFGLAFGDLCWIGMTRILGSLAGAVFRAPVSEEMAAGGSNGREP